MARLKADVNAFVRGRLKVFFSRFVDQVDCIAALALPINMEKHFIRQETMSRYPDNLIQIHFQSQKKC